MTADLMTTGQIRHCDENGVTTVYDPGTKEGLPPEVAALAAVEWTPDVVAAFLIRMTPEPISEERRVHRIKKACSRRILARYPYHDQIAARDDRVVRAWIDATVKECRRAISENDTPNWPE